METAARLIHLYLFIWASAGLVHGQGVTRTGCNCQAAWTWYNLTGFGYNEDDVVGAQQLKGCSNPDKDQKGSWCPVDPKKCPTYAGSLFNFNQTLYFDYCGPKVDANSLSQAQCECLRSWTWKFNATSSRTFSGCANPDNDPQGKWCPVDPKKCPGAYGNFTWQSSTYTYDYCGHVRDYTDQGCLCRKEWSGYVMARTHHGKCAWSKDFMSSYCFVDRGTCKNKPWGNKWDDSDDLDLCNNVNLAPTTVSLGSLESQAGCPCEPEWSLVTESKSSQSEKFKGCQYPDKDQKGPWCVVNPKKCPEYYDNFTQTLPEAAGTRVMQFVDYCSDVAERTQAGCLCQGQWGPNGKYLDGCANPDDKSMPWCYIRPGTCKNGSIAIGAGAPQPWDFCGSVIPSPPPPPSRPATRPASDTRAANGDSTPTTVATPANPPPAKKSSPTKYAIILAPIATVLAALTTMGYTLYKCHKKRTLFKNHQVMKLAAAIGTQVGAAKQQTTEQKNDQLPQVHATPHGESHV